MLLQILSSLLVLFYLLPSVLSSSSSDLDSSLLQSPVALADTEHSISKPSPIVMEATRFLSDEGED